VVPGSIIPILMALSQRTHYEPHAPLWHHLPPSSFSPQKSARRTMPGRDVKFAELASLDLAKSAQAVNLDKTKQP
jgi:hypothetical protein